MFPLNHTIAEVPSGTGSELVTDRSATPSMRGGVPAANLTLPDLQPPYSKAQICALIDTLQNALTTYHTDSIANLSTAIIGAIDEDRQCLEQLAASDVTVGFLRDRLAELINQQELRAHQQKVAELTATIFGLKVQMAKEKESAEREQKELRANLDTAAEANRALEARVHRMHEEFEKLRQM